MIEKPLKSGMEEEKMENSETRSQEKCDSIGEESTPAVGEERDETVALDANQALVIEGGTVENHVVEAVGCMNATQSEDSPLRLKIEGEIKLIDHDEKGDAPVSVETNELLLDQHSIIEAENESLPVAEASDTGSPPLSPDLQEYEKMDLQNEIEVEPESATEVCDEQEKSDARGDELLVVKEEMELLDNSDDGNVIPTGILEGKLEQIITEETPLPEVKMNAGIITEVNPSPVNFSDQENAHELSDEMEHDDRDDIHGHAEESFVSDNPVNLAENLEDAVGKEENPNGDDESETKFVDSEVETQAGDKRAGDEVQDEGGKMETEETASDVDEPIQDTDDDDSPAELQDEEDETLVAEEMETKTDTVETGKASDGKRKRGKSKSISKATTKASSRKKTVGEDVCFICFDGGELVLCDRRGCPKAYHPSCVNRDESFFKSGRWNCGWHLCSICEKNARYMCFTCTYSLCKSCTKDAVILCVRGNKGFCDTCMRTVRLIENNEQGNKDIQIDFDDKGSWEFLFKDYYVELKNKLSLSEAEILQAKNPWKGAETNKQELSESQPDANGGSGSDDSTENLEPVRPKRRRVRKQSKALSEEDEMGNKATSLYETTDWASRELLEFVSHMKDGDTSVLSQFDVQALLLEYIKRNKRRDPRRKSQIICDARLENIFGKPRVGHFEMLKLLESHFLTRDEQNDDVQGSVVDTENSQFDNDGNADSSFTKGMKERKRKSRKKSDRGPQSNLDDYAAIDMHNIGLIYMRRKLMEDLLEDAETFHDKVIGTFVRIRISGSNQKQDLYRLVQVVGTNKTGEPYKIGKKTTDIMVEILNLDKTEIVSIDTISNQEFSEDECKRLRQSIKCGLISRLTVGEILDKTTELQTVRVNDWLESETQRLSHLRDRASDLGRRKELRECVEKLQLLKTPEERRRRLEEFPEIHSDPKMDPSYESEDDSETEDSRQDTFLRSRDSNFSRRGRVPISPASDGAGKYSSKTWEQSKILPSGNFSTVATHTGEIVNDNSWSSERDRETHESNKLEKLNSGSNSASAERTLRMGRSESFSGEASVTTNTSLSTSVGETAVKINESEKMWHYEDPSRKIQGPFSMVQLRKWNNTGYFPADLKIWKATEKQENAIILSDALAGKFPKELPPVDHVLPAVNPHHSSHLVEQSDRNSGTSFHQDRERLSVHQKSGAVSNLSSENWRGSDFVNLPSPTPNQGSAGRSGADASILAGAIQSPAVNAVAPTAVLPNIGAQSAAAAAASILNSVLQTAPFSPTPNSQQVIQVASAVTQHTQSTTMSEPRLVNMNSHQPPPTQPIQTVIGQNLQNEAQSWGSNAQPLQPHTYGWGPANVQTSSGNFSNSGAPSGLQPDVRIPMQGPQPNMHPPTTPNVSWGIGPVDNNTSMGPRPENPNIAWGALQANPNMGWANPPAGNTNMTWGPAMQVPPPGNATGWVAPPVGNGGSNVQGMMPGNPNPGWANAQGWGPPPPGPPLGQAPMPGSGWGQPSANAAAGPPMVTGPSKGNAAGGPPMVPGPPQGNTGQGWGGPSVNQQQGSWGNDHNRGGNQFPGPRGGRGRDSSFNGGNRPWNRQSSFGGGGGDRGRNLSRKICPYNAKGRCLKGDQCDYFHA